MTHEVVFEKRVGERWTPVRSEELRPGDRTRMVCPDGTVLEEGEVTAKNAQDPDSKFSFDIGIGG